MSRWNQELGEHRQRLKGCPLRLIQKKKKMTPSQIYREWKMLKSNLKNLPNKLRMKTHPSKIFNQLLLCNLKS